MIKTDYIWIHILNYWCKCIVCEIFIQGKSTPVTGTAIQPDHQSWQMSGNVHIPIIIQKKTKFMKLIFFTVFKNIGHFLLHVLLDF